MSNRIAIKGEIDAALATDVVKKLLDFSDQHPNETITIYISSEGGSVTSGMAIYDVLSYIPNLVSTIADGCVGGIATLILAAGTPGMRCAYEGTQIRLGFFYAEQNTQQISPTIGSAIQKIYQAMENHTNLTVSEMALQEKVLDVEAAMEVGIIDIVNTACRRFEE